MDRLSLVPSYLSQLATYQAGKPISEVAREYGLTRISKLASNENPFGPSPLAIEAIKNHFLDLHRYPDMYAYDLRQALAQKFQLKMSNIVLGNGSEGIMGYIVRAFLGENQEVLSAEKSFVGFKVLSQSVGAKRVTISLDKNFNIPVEDMAKKITSKTKIIYIANPNNPTGTYMKKDEFDYLMKFVPEHVLVILDEAYFEYAQYLMGDYPDSMDYRYDNVITLRTFSKAYGLAGLRIGYGFAHEDLISILFKVKLPFEPGSLAQVAALAALKDQTHLEKTLQVNKDHKEKLTNYLDAHDFEFIPSITNFVSIKTGSKEASEFLFQELMKQGVIIRPLGANEMPDYIRVSIGSEGEMDHFYEALSKILPNYNVKFRN